MGGRKRTGFTFNVMHRLSRAKIEMHTHPQHTLLCLGNEGQMHCKEESKITH